MKSTLATPETDRPKVAQGNIIDRSPPGKCSHAKIPNAKRERIIALFIVGAVIASAVQLMMLRDFNASEGPNVPVHITAMPHDPIGIYSSTDFTEVNGVRSGSGTSTDPYVISDWEINATNAPGIMISGTDRHFIIRNVTVNSTAQNNEGIYLEMVYNGWIHNVTITNCLTGIRLTSGCSQIKIDESFISTNQLFGVQTQFSVSSYINISANRIMANYATGIALDGTQHFTIMSNNISTDDTSSSSRRAVTLVSCAYGLVTGNNLTAVYGEAMWSNTCQNVEVAGNRFSSQYAHGLYLTVCTGFMIYQNNFMGVPVLSGGYLAQAYDDRSTQNYWNASYPTGGNYWSDYTGDDQKKGPLQDQGGPDDIGDTPYIIDGNSQDRYPLVMTQPVEPIPEFPMLLLPIISILALLFAATRRPVGARK